MPTATLRQRLIRLSKSVVLLAAVLGGQTAIAQAERDTWRWFEIEVLVFKHSASEAVAESFAWTGPATPAASQFDPLPRYFAPDIRAALMDLPACNLPTVIPTLSQDSIWCRRPWEANPWLPMNWPAPQQALAQLAQLPAQVIDGPGGPVQQATGPYLAPAQQLELNEMRQQIIRRGVGEPLLHMSWYQPVFSLQQDYRVRLFGGKNYGATFAPSGYPYASEQDEFTQAEAAQESAQQSLTERLQQLLQLQQEGGLQFTARATDQPLPKQRVERPEQPEPVWELDGTVHVYLVGNYLHIDSDLELREPHLVRWQPAALDEQAEQMVQDEGTSQFLRSFKLDQLRRVISHETHYFDHPKLGLVVQIRRTDLSARRY
ncbi:hypothetical protein J6J34_09760 [Pseudidiomarina sp. 1ASP75-14]|uniref:CsiV family protein n=1 Tax=Pseudidiomarina terrestris TaxID=2820060 RepID=UPI00264B4B89|nr:CsiV family protein [Pseudidiomarina sp. 1ASP75-14]MDN7138494.1 hypothetical protein [Pseudidiomarina sp. 1ASP75-14]